MALRFLTFTCLIVVYYWAYSTARHIGHEIIKVTQHSQTPRSRRDLRSNGAFGSVLTGSDFPKHMEFTLHLKNKDMKLVMEKQLSPNDIVVSSDQGEVTFSSERSQYAVYQDIRTHSSMLVDCSHGADPCTLEGTFHNGGRKWSLSRMGDSGNIYNATEVNQGFDRSSNLQINPNKFNNRFRKSEQLYKDFLKQMNKEEHTKRKRSSSTSTTCNILEVELILDYTVYEYFLARESGVVLACETEIRRHFLALFGEVDLRYKCLIDFGICIRVFLNRIRFEKTQGSSWSNALLGNGNVEAIPTLLTCGLRSDSQTQADLKVCITRLNIEFLNDPSFRAVGFFGTVCQSTFSDFQAIITEDLGDDEDLVIASQILPYLNVTFDTAELDPECNSSLLFIGSQFDVLPQENGTETNPWKFSNCSRVQLQDWLAFLDATDNCLKRGGIDEGDLDNFAANRPLPGKIFDLDYQCQQSFGMSSAAVIGPGETSIFEVFDICYRGVYCDDDGKISRTRIYNGSPCGCKEICIKNECVREFNIPLGEPCLGCCECADQNAICDCETRTCVCAKGFYDTNLNMTNGTCKPLVANNEPCLFDEACEDEFAICNNDTNNCVCIEGWTLRHGVCVRVCSNDTLPPIERGMYIPQDNVVGSIANLMCEEGYAPTSKDTCSICLPDGNFSATMVQCERDCGYPPVAPNGDFVLDIMGNTSLGSTATLVCGEGFSTNITVTITCGDAPQGWASPSQNCTINDCRITLPTVADGMYVVTDGTTVGSIGTLICNHGYTSMSSEVSVVCLTNGSWSRPSTGCIRDCGCPPIAPDGNYVIDSGNTTLGSTATLSCFEGYSTSSVVTITCENTTEGWSDPSDNCTIKNCGSTLPSVTDGIYVAINGTIVGSLGTLVCNHGYTPISTDVCIVCLTNGTWSHPNTGCVRDCGCPSVAIGGDYILNTGNTTLGSVATLNCCEGYSTLSMVSITCEDTAGGWSDPADNCTINDCGITLPIVTNGIYVANGGTTVGSIGTLVCTHGYTPTSSDTCTVCLTNGSWSYTNTGCVRDCGCPPVAPNGDYVLNTGNTTLGSMATLICCEGYSTWSTVTITCEDTLEGWSDPSDNCAINDCGNSLPSVNNGMYIATNGTTVGNAASLVCDHGYTHISTDVCIVCLTNGSWSYPNTGCVRDCGCPPLASDGDYVLNTGNTTLGSMATLNCWEGYSTWSTVTITCEDTVEGWSDPSDNCTIIDCGSTLPSVINGTYVTSAGTTVGSVAPIVCANGYIPMSTDTCIVCLTNGSWSYPNTECVRDCGCPPVVSDGTYVLNADNTTLGSMATLSCCEGYQTFSLVTITCEDTAQGWSDPSDNCTIKDCGSTLPAVTDGMFIAMDGTTVGSIGTLVCDHGYSPISTGVCIVCLTNGSWSYPNAGCVRDCGCPPVAPNGDFVLNTDNTTLGFTATLNCCEGYSTWSTVTITCEDTTQGWSTPNDNCTINDCGLPLPVVTNGIIVTTGVGRTTVGSIGILVCNSGYTPNSTDTCVVCQSDGNWSSPSGAGCIRDCGCPPEAIFGSFSLDNPNNTVLGALAQYKCCPGYSTLSAVTITCEDTTQGWSRPSENCTINDCGSTPSTSNGSFVALTGSVVGSKAILECDYGFTPISSDTCIVCEFDGSWSSPMTECIRDCGCPPEVVNGEFVLDDDQNTTLGSTVELECCLGSSVISSVIITCQSSGWSTPSDNCTLNDCGSPPSVINGGFVAAGVTTFGAIATLVCDSGFTTTELLPVIICTFNGSWSHSNGSCVRDCGCPPVATNGQYRLDISDTTILGATATMICLDGYSTSTMVTITCENTTLGWSTPSETCIINECPDALLPSVTNGSYVSRGSTFGSLAVLNCNGGFATDSDDVCIVCQSNGTWSTSTTSCIRDCGCPPVATNGQYRLDISDTTILGATATLTCLDGYSTSIMVKITCENTTLGWSTPSETCIINECPDALLPSVTNGSYVSQGSSFGSLAVLNCNGGFEADSDDVCIVCQSNGTWSTSTTSCIRDCGCPPVATNGQYRLDISDTTILGATATLTCLDGYSTSTMVTITCENTTLGWSTPSETCIINECPDALLPSVTNGSYVSRGSTFGSLAVLKCYGGFATDSDDVCIVCQSNGTWSTSTTNCIRDCGCPPEATNGQYRLDLSDTTILGATATLSCLDGYSTSTMVTITCENTTLGWSTPSETCIIKDCPDALLPLVTNGSYVSRGSTFGSLAVLNCNGGFATDSDDVCIVCQSNGTWSTSTTNCIRDCGCPPVATNGQYRLDISDTTILGATATLTCLDGYSTSIMVKITCENTTLGWSTPSETCIINECPDALLPSVTNGSYVSRGSTFGSLAVLNCNGGFATDSDDVCIVCQSNGTWSTSTTSCIRDCGCPPVATNGQYRLDISDTTIFGATATLTCLDGYSTSIMVKITCENTTLGWSTPSETCILNECPDALLPSVTNGSYVSRGSTFGSLAVLNCNGGFATDSDDVCIVCQSNGTWSTSTTSCIRDCGCPPVATNGQYRLDISDTTILGATATLLCSDGYSTSTMVTITCENTTLGWSTPPETCTINECPDSLLPSVTGGSYVSQGNTFGSLAVLNCNGGFAADSDNVCIVCQSNGTWSLSSTRCITDCGFPPNTRNQSFILTSGTLLGATADIVCDDGSIPLEVNITCTASGWEDLTKAVCRNCPSGWIRFENTCYLLGNRSITNQAANASCNSFDVSHIYDSELVKIDSVPEREFLREAMKAVRPQPSGNTVGFWLGLFQTGATRTDVEWLPSGEPLIASVADWNPSSSEPNSDTQICSTAFRRFNYRWTDTECANIFNSEADGRLAYLLCEIDL